MKPVILLTGPSRESVSGISTHINQLFSSPLSSQYQFVHFEAGRKGHEEELCARVKRLTLSPFQFLQCLLVSRADIVHLNSPMGFKGYWRDSVYFLIAKLLRRKVVYQFHAGVQPERFFRRRRILGHFRKWQLGTADAVVLLTEKERQAALASCSFKRLLTIPNAINMKEFSNFLPKSFRKNRFNLVYIGRLVREKGVFEAVEAFALLRQEGMDNISLFIAGVGPAQEELKGLVQSLRLEQHVIFLGTVFGAAKTQFWREADLLVLPTYHEGLPYTLLEGLAAGVPVITTSVGGIPDAIENGDHGVFVEPRDIKGLAKAIRELLSDRDLLSAMSEACIRRARERFSVERLATEFDRLYQAVLSSHHGALQN